MHIIYISQLYATNYASISPGTARTKFAYTAKRCDEISLMKYDVVDILAKSEDGWWRVRLSSTAGWYPSNYLELYDQDTPSSPTTSPRTPHPNPSALYADTPNPALMVPGATIIRAKYDYKPAKSDELAFAAGDRLLLVDRTPEEGSHWWKAGTAPTGSACTTQQREGLVPKAYFIEETGGARDSTDSLDESSGDSTSTGGGVGSGVGSSVGGVGGAGVGKPFVGKDWYFGRIPRSKCDSLLNDHGREGDFIVRDSETNVCIQ